MPVPAFLSRIGGYAIEEEIGRGAFGAVYRARDPATGQAVALKVFSRAGDGAAAFERFRQEPRALLRAGPHPNLLHVHGAGEHAGLPYFVMDLVEGRSLEDQLAEEGPLPWPRACAIAGKIALALEHVHRAGLVHRDVKPANVLLDSSGEPRLIDLSLALDTQRTTRFTVAGQRVGTPLYMAPEQLREQDAGPRSDVFALGVVLYELIAGAPPFWAESIDELARAIESGAPPPSRRRPDLPEAVSRAVLHALEASLERRTPSAGAFARELVQATTTASTAAPTAAAGPTAALPRPEPGRPVERALSAAFPGYEELGVCGRGGAGQVLRARAADGSLVAIKVLVRAHETLLARFERERRLLGLFGEAEGFVPLLDSGFSWRGPFIVMPFAAGGSLRDRLARGRLTLDAALDLARRLAAAVARAHRRGVVHRDLKPENVLFTADGRPLVADLGLAKHFASLGPGATQSVRLSGTGEMCGSAGYMPLEQVLDATHVTPAADVFSLGAVLYECLAGHPTFQAEGLLELIAQVERGTYEPLSRARPEIPRWLERVVDRALSRDAANRYRDAGELAEALSGPRSRPRSRVVAAGVAPVVVATVLGLAAHLGASSARRAPTPAPASGPPSPPGPSGTPSPAPPATTTPAAGRPPPSSVAPADAGAPVWPAHPVAGGAPFPSLCAGFLETKATRLARVLGGYEWSHGNSLEAVAFLPDGKRAVAASSDGSVCLYGVPGGDRLRSLSVSDPSPVRALAVVGRDRVLTGAEDGAVTLWDLAGDEPPRLFGSRVAPTRGRSHAERAVAVSPDGRLALSGGADRVLRLWDLSSGALVREIPQPAEVGSVVFTPDGLRAVSACANGSLSVLEVFSGELVRSLEGSPSPVAALALAPGNRVLAGGKDSVVRLLDLDSGKLVRVFTGHSREVLSVAVSPDGRRALSTGRDGAFVWDLESGVRLHSAPGDWAAAAAFSPDGRLALLARFELPLALRDVGSWAEPELSADRHPGYVIAIAPLPGGGLATGGLDRTVRIRDAGGRVVRRLEGHEARIVALVPLPGEKLLSTSWDRSVRAWDLQRGACAARFDLPGELGAPTALATSPDGTRVAIGDARGFELLDVESLRRVATIATGQGSVTSVAFVGPNRVVSAGRDGSLLLFETAEAGLEMATGARLTPHSSPPLVAALPDGRWIVSFARQSLQLQGLPGESRDSVRWIRPIDPPCDLPHALAVSPDGRRAAGSASDRSVRLWDLERGGDEIDRIDLAPSGDVPAGLAFSLDGRFLIVGTKRGVVLWFELR